MQVGEDFNIQRTGRETDELDRGRIRVNHRVIRQQFAQAREDVTQLVRCGPVVRLQRGSEQPLLETRSLLEATEPRRARDHLLACAQRALAIANLAKAAMTALRMFSAPATPGFERSGTLPDVSERNFAYLSRRGFPHQQARDDVAVVVNIAARTCGLTAHEVRHHLPIADGLAGLAGKQPIITVYRHPACVLSTLCAQQGA